LGKMQATMEVGRILSRMQGQFPDLLPSLQPSGAATAVPSGIKTSLLWTVILVLTAGGLAATFFGARGVIRAKASANWPTTQGTIVESSVERETRRRTSGSEGRLTQTSYRAKISYEYTVDEMPFRGERIAYGDHGKIANSKRIGVKGFKIGVGGGKSARSYAQGIVDLYPKGKTLSVYYMPENPKECLLEPGLAAQAFSWPIAGIILLVIAVFIGSAAIAGARNEQKTAEQTPTGDPA
jgi:hypothetical protein